MPTKLRGLKLTRIDLVDKGANPGAHVTLFKRDEEEDNDVTDQEHQAQLAELQAQVETLTKRAEAAEAKVAELTPPKDADPIEKADPEVREAIAKARAEAAEAKAEVVKMREDRERTEYIAKAAEFKDVMGPADEFGPLYRKIAKVASKEELAAFEQRLRSIVEVGKTSKVFAEAGKGGSDNPGNKYEQMRKRAAEQYPDVSPEQAVEKFLDTQAGREWYDSAKED